MARVGWIAFFMARVVIQASVSSWRGFSGDHGDTRDFQARDIYLRRWRGNGYTRDGPGGALLLAAFPAEAAAIQGQTSMDINIKEILLIPLQFANVDLFNLET
ncbi:hypothetical protein F5887DRAFT_923454 [Amanita rubescens]|nr:hypothetical protein F5887DRAFT_923454 [Amanita rubescens]